MVTRGVLLLTSNTAYMYREDNERRSDVRILMTYG